MGTDAAAEGEFEVDEDWVRYEVVEPHIAQITINRPDRRNAILSPDMHNLFKERLTRENYRRVGIVDRHNRDWFSVVVHHHNNSIYTHGGSATCTWSVLRE